MTALSVGHVYVVRTALVRAPRSNPTQGPKHKIALCICAGDGLFFWFNTEPAVHGVGQLPARVGSAPGLTRDCHLDLSRVVMHPQAELATAEHRGRATDALIRAAIAALEAGVRTLPPRHADLALANLKAALAS